VNNDVKGHHRPDQGGACGAAGRGFVAGLIITTEAMVTDVPQKAAPAMPGGGGGMGGMDY